MTVAIFLSVSSATRFIAHSYSLFQENEFPFLFFCLQEPVVTYVGIYNIKKKENKRVFIHDKKIHIVNATINQEQTFIGFVILEYDVLINAYGEKQNQDIYRAFLVEIQPQNRVFYLNYKRPYFICLQFLYGQYKGQANNR